MMHAPDSTLKCDEVPFIGNSLSVSTLHSHLGKLAAIYRGHPIVHMSLLPPC